MIDINFLGLRRSRTICVMPFERAISPTIEKSNFVSFASRAASLESMYFAESSRCKAAYNYRLLGGVRILTYRHLAYSQYLTQILWILVHLFCRIICNLLS